MRFFVITVSFLFCSCSVQKKNTESSSNNSHSSEINQSTLSNAENVAQTLSYLASDELEGRDTGSEGIEKASVFLEKLLKKNNIPPYFKSYRDTLSNFKKPAYNIVGYLEGNDPVLKNEFVIIGAHYDHIGKISAVNGDDIGNGANDNASGSTAVTEVIKYFSKIKNNKRSILFVFFSAEEKGLLGSKHLAQKLKNQNLDLYFMFNFEMIGVPMNRTDMLLYLTGFGRSNMAQIINQYAGEKLIGYIPAETQYQLFRASDNYPFYTEFEVPSQTVSSFDFENFDFYHQPDDEFEKMDPKHISNIVNKISPVLEKMINSSEKEIKLTR